MDDDNDNDAMAMSLSLFMSLLMLPFGHKHNHSMFAMHFRLVIIKWMIIIIKRSYLTFFFSVFYHSLVNFHLRCSARKKSSQILFEMKGYRNDILVYSMFRFFNPLLSEFISSNINFEN